MRHYNSKIMAGIIMCLASTAFLFTNCGEDDVNDNDVKKNNLNKTEQLLVGEWGSASGTIYYIINGDTATIEPIKDKISFSLYDNHGAKMGGYQGKWYADGSNLSVTGKENKLYHIIEATNVKLEIYEDFYYENYNGKKVTERHVFRMVKN